MKRYCFYKITSPINNRASLGCFVLRSDLPSLSPIATTAHTRFGAGRVTLITVTSLSRLSENIETCIYAI